MRARHLYLGLCLIGTLLPLGAFLPLLGIPGAGPGLFLQQLFATPVSGFFGWDVIVSSLVLWTFVMQPIAPTVKACTASSSLAKPIAANPRSTRWMTIQP